MVEAQLQHLCRLGRRVGGWLDKAKVILKFKLKLKLNLDLSFRDFFFNHYLTQIIYFFDA